MNLACTSTMCLHGLFQSILTSSSNRSKAASTHSILRSHKMRSMAMVYSCSKLWKNLKRVKVDQIWSCRNTKATLTLSIIESLAFECSLLFMELRHRLRMCTRMEWSTYAVSHMTLMTMAVVVAKSQTQPSSETAVATSKERLLTKLMVSLVII